MLDPRRLRVLVEVARQGSITAAAESLSFVPSAVSQQIAALERELGVKLTARVGRGTELTSAGRLLVERAEELLSQLGRAEDAVRSLDGVGSGRLRVGAFTSAGATIVPGALGTLAHRHPGLALSLVAQDPEQSIVALKRHEVDVAVIHRSPFEPQAPKPGVAERQLLRDELRLAVARDHALASKRRAPLESFAQDAWVLAPRGTRAHALASHACRVAGFTPTVAYTTDDTLLALRLVAAGLGVALVPTLSVAGLSEQVALVPLHVPPARAVLVAWRQDDDSEAVALMIKLMAREAKRVGRR